MSGELEGAMDAVTAGLAGRAVEPAAEGTHAGTAAAGQGSAHGGRCLNCGTVLIGEYCHACGQSGHVHRSVGAIGHEIAHGVFHFEGKIWRTLPMLAFHPGDLTRRYAQGERARFVSPLAIFLFSVFLMFAIVANLPGYKLGGGDFLKPATSERLAETRRKVSDDLRREQIRLAGLRRDLAEERADATPDADRLSGLARRIDRSAGTIRDLSRVQAVLPAPDGQSSPDAFGGNWFEQRFKHAKENPELVLYKMKTSAYKYSWALIPLSVPFLWLLFPFSRRFALYDHAIFATYSLSFMSLLTIVLAVLSTIGVATWAIVTAATIIPVIHIYKQLKGAYSLGRWSALMRTTLLVGFILWIIVPAFALALVYLGVAD